MRNKETWKPVLNFESLYEISSFGKIRSLVNKYGKRKRPRIVKPSPNYKGYLCLGLSKNANRKHASVHRLVAQAFIPNPKNKLTVNHKDGNKSNNHVDNLEWCTNQENMAHAYRTGIRNSNHHRGEMAGRSKSNRKQIKEIRSLLKLNIFSNADIGRKFGVSRQMIRYIKVGHSWSWLK